MRELTGEAEEEARCDASGVKERDHRTMPPAKIQYAAGNWTACGPLWDIEQWSSMAEETSV
jgi:hypothetical protein